MSLPMLAAPIAASAWLKVCSLPIRFQIDPEPQNLNGRAGPRLPNRIFDNSLMQFQDEDEGKSMVWHKS